MSIGDVVLMNFSGMHYAAFKIILNRSITIGTRFSISQYKKDES